jgi:arylformamidase
LIDLNNPEIFDISMSMHKNMPLWPGERHHFHHEFVKSTDKGDSFNVSRVSCSMHTGTHIDAPFHKISDGDKLEDISIERFFGRAKVLDLMNVDEKITISDLLDKDLDNCDICLLKTKNSLLMDDSNFHSDYVVLDIDAAKYLVDKKIKAVGVDYLGVDSFTANEPVLHNLFFENDIMIYEGVNLNGIADGEYFFIGLPMKIFGSEGAPVRAVLIR